MSKQRTALGKGLDALIPRTSPVEKTALRDVHPSAPQVEVISHLMIAQILPNPYQPRADFDEVALDELKR
ncbi:MAG TPA: chromosome partitioning protein ParB, partial [Bacteroidota bacterium]